MRQASPVTLPALEPTARTRITRSRERSVTDRGELHAFLGQALLAHVGLIVDDHPAVIPSTLALDPAGPDEGGTLYLHGSVGAGWLRRAPGSQVCVTVSELDGLVIARSGFHHSMNFRSAVVIGAARLVTDERERGHALDLIVDQVVPGRAATLRPPTRKELAATCVLAVPLAEASMKQRGGPPNDDPADLESGMWGGVLPLRTVAGPLEPDQFSTVEPPTDVVTRAGTFG